MKNREKKNEAKNKTKKKGICRTRLLPSLGDTRQGEKQHDEPEADKFADVSMQHRPDARAKVPPHRQLVGAYGVHHYHRMCAQRLERVDAHSQASDVEREAFLVLALCEHVRKRCERLCCDMSDYRFCFNM